jgi:hypothetical protein
MALNGGSRLLTLDDIVSINDVPHEDVIIPEWNNGTVRVQGMTVAERNAWEASNTHRVRRRDGRESLEMKPDAMSTFRQRLVARCLVDENGKRLFSDAQIHLLEKKSAAAIERIVTVASRLNGTTQADLEELEKNSEQTGEGDDYSDSQASLEEQSAN